MAPTRRVRVSVHPRASRRRVAEVDGVLHAWLTAAPAGGAANRELVALVAGHYGVAKSAVTIVSGLTARQKLLEIRC